MNTINKYFITAINILALFGLISILNSCKKEKKEVPIVKTSAITNITDTSAFSGGTITDEDSGTIIAKGVCWSTDIEPTIADSKTTDGTGTGPFTSSLTGLTENTIYYLRAYATNSNGTYYGDLLSFSTKSNLNNINFNTSISYETVTDIDGNTYKTLQIISKGEHKGSQTWMAENLKTTKFNDGSAIPLEIGSWTDLSTPAYCWYNNTDNTYGALYNWYAVNTEILCPVGWHVPTHEEWEILFSYFGGYTEAGGKLKESGTSHWKSPNTGTNESGFTALPGGVRDDSHEFDGLGIFRDIGLRGSYTSSTPFYYKERGFVRMYTISHEGNGIGSGEVIIMYAGLSVRCVQD